MIPTKADNIQVTSNFDPDSSGQFTVDENSLAKIMSVLTNLYSDPELAVVREYLTNALDAQIEAQEADKSYVWRPIEVTTPSHFAKEYKVRDFGTGMSVDDIKEIYSKYGKSTKENSNAVTGMLGLGSKCALTYTGQFTITGYKNGVRTRAIVSKDDNDIPVFMIVDTRASDEPNGVEISVPVRDRNTFEQKTKEFLRWWKPGQVLVNGHEPTAHSYPLVSNDPITVNINGKDVTTPVEVHLIENTYRYGDTPQSYVVMGNVPYQVDKEYVEQTLTKANLGFVAYVPMGSVDFPPSREKLFYNARTKKVVSKISEGLFNKILDEKLAEITNAPDYQTAWTLYHNLNYNFSSNQKAQTLTYKGEPFKVRKAHSNMRLSWDYNGHGQISERSMLDIESMVAEGPIIVTGVKQDAKVSSYFKKKVRHYMKENNILSSFAVLVEDDVDVVWCEHLERIDADTIKAIKLPRDGVSAGPRAEATYDFWVLDNGIAKFDTALTVDPGTKTLVYISPQDMKETYRKSGTTAEALIKQLGDDVVLVILGKNRFEKFLRTHKGKTAAVFIREKIKALTDAATDEEFMVSEMSYGQQEYLNKVAPASLDDPSLKRLAEIVQGKSKTADNYKRATDLANYARRASVYVDVPAKRKVGDNTLSKYPLIGHVGARETKHLTFYCNAVYAQNV